MIESAKAKTLSRSPVAYAGWTTDVNELLELAAKGPVSWFAILGAWLQTKDDPTANVFEFIRHVILNYPLLYIVAAGGISLFIKSRSDELLSMRTSSSTTLDELHQDSGARKFVLRTAELFDATQENDAKQEAQYFEAPTIIRYESGQVLKPHFDANRDATTEDANRGGQTLATLLVYLNDVATGGRTRFGKLPAVDAAVPAAVPVPAPAGTDPTNRDADEDTCLSVQPKLGDALLFFPADRYGTFDERTEHEGCPAVDEKWIARIWRHQDLVPPPFGLSSDALRNL
eukprot:CAMPEP_0174988064 /NCGR_PEP_ID=MMETSP0004_2-20121128/19906_1 /TAXON_ID=420556 /ORGANISM="Ochromonas sp., Strain CCMP1393" /LENGTH=286 /DNA_ID=CAMNT_0016241215 /DNA_START=285 /DNA_END=1145 /DNA_ORIENTATION=+